jgi:hypothetical protein
MKIKEYRSKGLLRVEEEYVYVRSLSMNIYMNLPTAESSGSLHPQFGRVFNGIRLT